MSNTRAKLSSRIHTKYSFQRLIPNKTKIIMKAVRKIAFVLALLIAGTSMGSYAQDKDKKEKEKKEKAEKKEKEKKEKTEKKEKGEKKEAKKKKD